MDGSSRSELWVQGQRLDLVARPGVEPTVFSLFLANTMRVGSGDVIDAGAGCGVLAIAAKLLGAGRTTAVERHPEACDVLRANVGQNGVDVVVVEQSIDTFVPDRPAALVVSNPPTIPEVDELPAFATGAGPDGLRFLRTLVDQSAMWLEPGGSLQVVVSSLIDLRAFEELARTRGFDPRPTATLVVPFRSFYGAVYRGERLAEVLEKGLATMKGSPPDGELYETLVVYDCCLVPTAP